MPANHPQDLPQVWFEVGESEFAVLPAPVLDQGTTKQYSQPLTATQRLLDSRERVHSLLDGIPPTQHPMVRTSYPPPPSNQKASADERPLSRDLEPFSRPFSLKRGAARRRLVSGLSPSFLEGPPVGPGRPYPTFQSGWTPLFGGGLR